MLDPVIEALRAELLKRFPADKPYPLQEINSIALPSAIKNLLTNRLEAQVSREVGSLDVGQLKWVDTDHVEVRTSFDQLLESARQHALIPADRWANELGTAIADLAASLGDPVRAMVQHVYNEDDESLTVETILFRIQSFPGPPSLRDAVHDSASRRNVAEISADRFESLVSKVNDLRCEGFTAVEWLQDLAPLSDLFSETRLENGLPANFVADFLKQHGLEREAAVLLEYGDDKVSLDAALTLVTEIPEELEVTPVTVAGEEPAPVATAGQARDGGAVPLWQRYQKNLNAPYEAPAGDASSRTAAVKPTVKTTEPKREAVSLGSKQDLPPRIHRNESVDGTRQPLWQRFHTTPRKGSTQVRDVADLERAVLGEKGLKDRDIYINHLFGGSEEEYRLIVVDLHDAQDWSEASRVIAEDVFKRHQVNIYSEPAVAFTNAVEARFRSRGVRA